MKPLNLDPNVDYLSQYAAPVDIPEWRKSLGSFASETKALGSGLKALGAQALGAEETRDEALADYQRNMDEASSGWKTPEVGRIEDIKLTEDGGVGRFGAYLAHTVPKGIAQLGALALGGGVAGGVAKATASTAIKQLAKQGVKKSAEKLVKRQLAAAGGAVAAGGFGMETGQSYGQFANDPEIGPEKAVGPALAYGGVASVLEFMPIAAGAKAIGLNRMLLRKVIKADPELSKKAIKLAQEKKKLGLTVRALKATGKVAGKAGGAAAAGAGVEGLTEGMQSLAQLAAERYAKEDPEWASIVPRTPEEWSGFWNEAAAGAATGFFAGAAAGPFTGTPQAKQPVPEPQPESVQEPIVPDAQAPLTPTQTPATPPVDLNPEVPGVVAPQTDPEAQPETTQEPVPEAVIPEAAPDESLADYVLRVSENGVPPAVYDKLQDAATEAGVEVTEEMQPQDVVDAIKARRGDVVVHTTSPQEASPTLIQPEGETDGLSVQENPEAAPKVLGATPSPAQAEELQWTNNQLFPEERRDEAALELDAIAPDSKMAKSKEVLEASTIGATIFPEEMVEALKIIEEAYTRGRTSSGIDLKYIQGSIEDTYGQETLDSLNAVYDDVVAKAEPTQAAVTKSEKLHDFLGMNEPAEQAGRVDVLAGLDALLQEDVTPDGWVSKPNSFGDPTWLPDEASSSFVQKVANPKPNEAYLAVMPNGKLEYFATQKEAVDTLTDSLQAEARPGEGDPWVAIREPEPPTTAPSPSKTFTKISGQQGSNKGGWYEDAEGKQYYIKEPKSIDHGISEQLAQILYDVAGVSTPIITVEASVPGLKGPALASAKAMEYNASAPLKDGFVTDAWLGNWDVVGDDGKNYITFGENAVRIDFGGALRYRAQGGLKGSNGTKPFGNFVTELSTMRDPAINPKTAAAFKDVTDADIIKQAAVLRNSILPDQILGIVNASNEAFGGERVKDAEALAKTLIARRQYILDYAATLQEKGDVSSLQGWMKDWNASDPTKIEDALLATNPHDLVWAEIPSKNSRYGVLVINPADGKVLMREPTNHYDGYNWTFAKGGKNPGEHPLEAAKRETKEETGVDTTIVGMVGKPFYSSSSTGAVFYVGVSKGAVETIGNETQSTKWMSYGEARRSIKEGSNKGGVARDLEILEYLFGKKQVDDVAEYPIQKGAIHAKAFYESGEFASSFPASPFKHKDWGTLTKLQKLNVATASRLVKTAGDTGSVSGAEVVKAVNTLKTAFKNWSGVMLSKTTKGDVDYGKPESAWKIKTGVPVVIEGYHGTSQKGIVGDQLNIRGHAGSGVGGADTTFDGGAFFTFGKKKQAKSAGSKVYEFYISFKNPKVINYNGGYSSSKLISEISEAKAAGYDGLIAQNMQDLGGKGTQFITWHRNQVKTRELENLGYSSDKTSKIYESHDSEAPTKATTSFVATTDAALGQGWTQRAIDAGLLIVNEKSPKGSASGSFNPTTNQLTVNLDKVPSRQTVVDVLLHEGSHAGLEVMLGDQFKGFHSDLLKLVGMGDPTAVLAIERATWGSINAINKHREKVGLEPFPHRVKDKTLPEGERKAELDRVRKLIDELNPRLLPEEDLAYYVQTASSTAPTSAGFWNRLKRALQAWFAGTDFGKALAGIGWRPELAPDLAVALAKAATRQTLTRVEAEIQLVGARSKVLTELPVGANAGLLESRDSGVPNSWSKGGKLDEAAIAETLYSMPSVDEWGDSKTWLTSATSTMPEDYNTPGVFNKAFHGMVDRFDYVKGKSLDLYRAFDEWKNRQGALQQEIQRIYLDPMRHLVSRYQPTEADAEPIRRAQVAAGVDKAKYTDVEITGHQLAARHILEDKVTEKLALKAAPEFLEELKKELSPHNVGLLNNAIKAMTGDSIAIDELTTPQARQLFETYLPAKKPDSDIATRWELYNRRSAGYSIAQPGTKAAKEDTAAGFINAHELYTPQVKNREIFKQIGELSDQLAAHQLKLLQEGGVLEQSSVDRLSNTYKHYVPLRREAFDYDQELKEMFEKPVANVGKLMTRKGSIELPSAVHVLQNHLASGFTAASAAARNQMMNKFADEIYKDQSGWKSWFYIKDERVHKNDVGFIRNGKPLYIVPAEGNLRAASIVKVIAGKDAQDLSGPLKIMRSVNNWIRWSNVSASPAFMLANTPRDYLTAVYNLQASDAKDYVKEIASLKAYKESFKALHKVMVQGVRESDDPQVQEWIDLVESFERAGGKTSFVEALRAMDGGSWKSFEAQVKRRKGKLGGVVEFGADQLERIENLNIVLENVMRLSTYKVMRNKYQTDPKFNGMTQLQAEERAAEIARNLTTNFTRRGAHIDAMNTWWLFYNATVQGNWQVIQNLFLNPNKAGQRKLQKAIAGTIMFAFLIDQLGRALSDDEDDDGVSDWDARTGHEKDRKISAPFSVGGVFPAIPAPWVFNVFWRLGGMLGEVKDGVLAPQDAVLDTMGLMFTSMNPISSGTPAQAIAPSAFDPFMQIIENRNFVGNPLGPDGFPGSTTRPDSYLAWDSTPAGYKHVAEFVNDVTGGSPVESGEADFRPSSYKVLTEFALGSLGRTIVDLGKLGLSPVMDGMDFEGPEKVPGLKVFLTAPSDSTAISHYHDRVAKVLGAKRLTKLYSAGVDKDSEKLAEVQRDRAAVLRMVPQVEDTERQIRSLRKAIRSARGNSRTEETLRNRIVQLQKRFNQSYTRRIGN